ncbi:hypothetical protein MBORA_16160 [Methanobrevibacter oralis]|uniref:Uncharacterized protein n=2 Tax=Methanobrevibacter oralis TaxID=66851 RepID=A0A165ZZE8_METOA|nr:hypothetical protein [Methanobrevibacter oralis]KZX11371.1 hypothetical protein MBORA_16160 [Methanobrevibacter oralis]
MTKKNENKKTTTANKNNKMMSLYEAVQENKTENFIIIGALTKAGLINQYIHEKEVYLSKTEEIKPTITDTELNKIIKNYTGE